MIVALLTDFGTRDHYVGTMKGVVLSVCPEATLVDLTHEVPPQDILTGALELAAAFSYFPPGTVFLVVVDPGVGTARRGIVADAGGYRFVGPDNGVLSVAFAQCGGADAIAELREPRFARSAISNTFEGRDRFAPAAGWLARGTDLQAFGPAIVDAITLDVPVPQITADGIVGEIVRVDHFGNLITNIGARLLAQVPRPVVSVGGSVIHGVARTYAAAATGELCAIVSSTGHLEIAVSGGNAAERLQAGARTRVSVRNSA